MLSDEIREHGESVTVVRLSRDRNEESIVAKDVVCLIDRVEGQYEHWTATLEVANPDIRPGDILRRDNGLELQVLRSDTQADFDGGYITDLDLKNYDRQEPPVQENEVAMLEADFFPEHQFHPMIPQNVWSSFSQRAYGSAVFEAFKQVEIAVREAGGYNEEDIGVNLIGKAFNEKTGNLADQNQHPDEQNARLLLFRGAIGAYKNPGSHRDVAVTAEEAIEMIALASLLLRIVDSRTPLEAN